MILLLLKYFIVREKDEVLVTTKKMLWSSINHIFGNKTNIGRAKSLALLGWIIFYGSK